MNRFKGLITNLYPLIPKKKIFVLFVAFVIHSLCVLCV